MPFIFDAGDFEEPQTSQMEDFLTSMFGEAAQGVKKGFEDKREDDRFQKQLGLAREKMALDESQFSRQLEQQKSQSDWQRQKYDEGISREKGESAASAEAMSGLTQRQFPRGQPATPMNLASYQAAQAARAEKMRKTLAGLPAESHAPLVNAYMSLEHRQRDEAARSDLADRMRAQAFRLGASASAPAQVDTGTPPSSLVLAGRKNLAQRRSEMSQQMEAIADAVSKGQMTTEQGLEAGMQVEQQLGQMSSALQQMEAQENSRMRVLNGYQSRLQVIQQRLAEEEGRSPQNEPFISHMREQLDQLEPMLMSFQEDPNMSSEDLAGRWESAIRDFRWSSQGKQATDWDKALEYLDKDEARLRSRAESGFMSPEDLQKRLMELDANREEILQMRQGQGAEQPPQEQPQQAPPMDKPQMVRKLALGKSDEVLAAYQAANKTAAEAEADITALKPEVAAFAEKLNQRGGAGRGAAEVSIHKSKTEERFRKEVGAEPPKTKEDWLLAMDDIVSVADEEDRKRTLTRPSHMRATPSPDSERYVWSHKAKALLKAIGAANGWGQYNPKTMADEIVALRQKRGQL